MSHTCANCYHVTTRPKPDVCKICQNGSNWVDRDRPTDVPTVKYLFGLDDLVVYTGDNPLLKSKTGVVNEITALGIDVRFEGGMNHWVVPENIVPKYPTTNLGTKQPKVTESDQIVHPSHYTQGAVECIDAIRSALTAEEFRGYCKGNIIKYAFRERLKGGDNDVRKAAWYAAKLLEVSDAK